MRILFAGTPEIAVPSLSALAGEFDVCGVLTNPDRPSGRGRKTGYSPVKEKAIELGLNVLQPDRLNASFRDVVRGLQPDILTVVAFSRLFGPKFLSLFPQGGINLHPSLLPQYRGPSPIQAAIKNGDSVTGITVQKLSLELDAGDIIIQKELALDGSETAGSLTEFCAGIGAEMMVEAVSSIHNGTVQPVPQNHEKASYCSLIQKTDGIIDWSLPAENIDRVIRAYNPWPSAFTHFNGTKLSIKEAAIYAAQSEKGATAPGTVLGMDKKVGILIQTGNGVICITRLQLQAKKEMDFLSFLNGVHGFIGSTLGG